MTTVIFQRLRQPVVLGYILAGLIVGPHVPIPLVADRDIVQTLSELGVILLMFSLGLEFSLRKLVKVGADRGPHRAHPVRAHGVARLRRRRALRLDARESMFAGAIIAISSTTIIAKAFDEQQITGRLRELVVGVLDRRGPDRDSAHGHRSRPSHGRRHVGRRRSLRSSGRLGGVPGRRSLRRHAARAARECGRSTARGAPRRRSSPASASASPSRCSRRRSATRSRSARSSRARWSPSRAKRSEVEHLVNPVRDLFAAIFFVSVGMLIDPAVIADALGGGRRLHRAW